MELNQHSNHFFKSNVSVAAKFSASVIIMATVMLISGCKPLLINMIIIIAAAMISAGTIILKRIAPFLYICFMMILIHSIANPANSTYWYFFGIEGIMYGLNISLRLLAIVTAANWFIFTSDISDISAWFTRINSDLGIIVSLVLSILPAMKLQMKITMDVQSTRGLDFNRSLAYKLRSYIAIIVPVIIKTIIRAHEMSRLLYLRGHGKAVKRVPAKWRLTDYAVITPAVVLFLVNIWIIFL